MQPPEQTPEPPAAERSRFRRRVTAAHREWVKPVLIGAAATVLGGAIWAALILVDRQSNGSGTNSTSVPAPMLETGGVLQARDETRGRSFSGYLVPIDARDRVIFRLRLHNVSNHDLDGVIVTPDLWPPNFAPVNVNVDLLAWRGQTSQQSKVQIVFDPSRGVGGPALDPNSFRLLDQHLGFVRKIPPDVRRGGSSTNQIAVGALPKGATEYIEFAASLGYVETSPGQLGGGTILLLRHASEPRTRYRALNLVASPGQVLVASLELHNGGATPVKWPFVTIRLSPAAAATFGRLTADIHVPDSQFRDVRSDPVIVNYKGANRARLVYVPSSTVAYHCLDETCSRYRSSRLPDGITQGGIRVARQIGGAYRGGDPLGPTPRAHLYVNFRLRVEAQ